MVIPISYSYPPSKRQLSSPPEEVTDLRSRHLQPQALQPQSLQNVVYEAGANLLQYTISVQLIQVLVNSAFQFLV